MSTESGLVFSAEEFGEFTALDGRSGKPLWHFNTGDVITASPITYSVGGKQYVAIVATGCTTIGSKSGGDSLVVFALP